jgi:hypothetical protein
MKLHKKILMNSVEIDEGIAELIQTLWDNGIETIQSCQGGYMLNEKTRFTHLNGDKIIENAHIIFFRKDLNRIKDFLPNNTEYIIGDKSKEGYLEEWLGLFDGVWANFKL